MLGLRKVAPIGDTTNGTTIDGVVNWLSDSTMLPAAVPEARIFTYDWDANYFENAPVQTLLGHADNFLALIATEQGPYLDRERRYLL
ncbi:hypothetical protein DL767_010723 [Monosporascus sp. MG133]|nr:hypothetical protein DL767_010723 [Monosporascus sp. MG133]